MPEAIAASIVIASVLALGGWCRFPRFVPQVGNGVLDISVKCRVSKTFFGNVPEAPRERGMRHCRFADSAQGT